MAASIAVPADTIRDIVAALTEASEAHRTLMSVTDMLMEALTPEAPTLAPVLTLIEGGCATVRAARNA